MAGFRTDLLEAAIRAKRIRLERQRRQCLMRVAQALRSAAGELGVREAFLVGSVTRERGWSEHSDVDVATSGADPLRVMVLVEQASGRAVDVIDLDRHPLPALVRRHGVRIVG